MNRRKGKAVSQLTLDDDYNVPDSKPDVQTILQERGRILIEEVVTSDDNVTIRGSLNFEVLYMGDITEGEVNKLEGSIPFEEKINMEGIKTGDNVGIKYEIDDLSVELINSRKINVRTIITFLLEAEELYDEEVVLEAHSEDEMEFMTKEFDVMQMTVNKKDTYRIKDEIVLSPGKVNIHEILWDSIQTRNLETRVLEDKISIQGELLVFILYQGDDEAGTMQWIEASIPVSGLIDCYGCNEDMISNIDIRIAGRELEIAPDFDGEDRVVHLDVILELDIKMYSEERVHILSDVYGITKTMIPVKSNARLENLLVKNASKCRVTDRMKIQNKQVRILQLCHGEGEIKIDEVNVIENGITVEGVIAVNVLYVTSDDKNPLYATKGMIPFKHVIEADGINPSCVYDLKADIEQLSLTMIDGEEVEVKAILNLCVIVLKKIEEPMIIDITVEPIDFEKLQEMPGIIGYIAKKEDSLWSIGKEYKIPIYRIKEMNGLENDEIKQGERLIIVKEMEALSL